MIAPNVRAKNAAKLIEEGAKKAEQGQVQALAERLKGIRRRAPAAHRWSLFESGLSYQDAARVVIGVQAAVEELCLTAAK